VRIKLTRREQKIAFASAAAMVNWTQPIGRNEISKLAELRKLRSSWDNILAKWRIGGQKRCCVFPQLQKNEVASSDVAAIFWLSRFMCKPERRSLETKCGKSIRKVREGATFCNALLAWES
jgi:hypothetical protein